jgi:hypothetical protein
MAFVFIIPAAFAQYISSDATATTVTQSGGEWGVWWDNSPPPMMPESLVGAIEQGYSLKADHTTTLYTIAIGDPTSSSTWSGANLDAAYSFRFTNYDVMNTSMGDPRFSEGPTAGSSGNGNLVFLVQHAGCETGMYTAIPPKTGICYDIAITKGPLYTNSTISTSNTAAVVTVAGTTGEGYFDPFLIDINSTTSYLFVDHYQPPTSNACRIAALALPMPHIFLGVCHSFAMFPINMSGVVPTLGSGTVLTSVLPVTPASGSLSNDCLQFNKPNGATYDGIDTFTVVMNSNAYASNGDGISWYGLSPGTTCATNGWVLGGTGTVRFTVTTGGVITNQSHIYPPPGWVCVTPIDKNSGCYNEWSVPIPVGGDEAYIIYTATFIPAAQIDVIQSTFTGPPPLLAAANTNGGELAVLDLVSGTIWPISDFATPGTKLNTNFNFSPLSFGGEARPQYEPHTKMLAFNVNNGNASGSRNWSILTPMNYPASPLAVRSVMHRGTINRGTVN